MLPWRFTLCSRTSSPAHISSSFVSVIVMVLAPDRQSVKHGTYYYYYYFIVVVVIKKESHLILKPVFLQPVK